MTEQTDLRKLHEAATPAPWLTHIDLLLVGFRDNGDGTGGSDYAVDMKPEDINLIAATRNALPYLLDVVGAARWVDRVPGDPNWEPRLSAALAALDAHLAGKP